MKRRSQRFLLAACTALAVVATLSTALRAYGQPAIGARDVEQLHGDTLDLAQPGDGAGDLCCFVAGRGRPEAAAVSEVPCMFWPLGSSGVLFMGWGEGT